MEAPGCDAASGFGIAVVYPHPTLIDVFIRDEDDDEEASGEIDSH